MEAHIVTLTTEIARLSKTIQGKEKMINNLVNSLKDLQQDMKEQDLRTNIVIDDEDKRLRRGNNRRVFIFIRRRRPIPDEGI